MSQKFQQIKHIFFATTHILLFRSTIIDMETVLKKDPTEINTESNVKRLWWPRPLVRIDQSRVSRYLDIENVQTSASIIRLCTALLNKHFAGTNLIPFRKGHVSFPDVQFLISVTLIKERLANMPRMLKRYRRFVLPSTPLSFLKIPSISSH